jgi:hypothetical protein
MVLTHGSPSSKHSYPNQTFWIYFILSNLFSLLPLSVLVNLFFFLYFQDDLEYRYILMSRKVFVGYDQTITNDVEPTSFELVLPQICPVYHYFLFDLSLCSLISNITSAFQLYSYSECIIFL